MMLVKNKKCFFSILLIISMLFGLATIYPRFSSAQNVPQNLAETTVTQEWMFPAGGSIVSAPIVAGGFVYAYSQDHEGNPAYVYCLDASTGAQVWVQNTKNPVFTPLTVTGGCVYGSAWNENPSETLDGVFCLNASTGNVIWTYANQNQSFGGSPVVSGGVVYVSGYNYTLSTDTNISLVYALNASTGKLLWQFQGPVGNRFGSVIDVGNDVYAASSVNQENGSSASAIYALSASNGTSLWAAEFAGSLEAMVETGNAVYASYDNFDLNGTAASGGILALDMSTGQTLWNQPINDPIGGPTIGTDAVFVFSGAGNVYALRASDGSMIWSFSSGVRLWTYPNAAAPLLVNGYLYVSNYNGVYCLSALNGAAAWTYKTDDYAFAPGGSGGASLATQPVYANGELYLGSGGPEFFSPWTWHNVYALDALTGVMLWNYTVPYNVWSAPTVVNRTLYVAAVFASSENPDFEGGGALYAFKETSSASTSTSSPNPTPGPRTPPPGAIIVPDDYATIQDAIDAAANGSIIFVRAGTYYAGSASGIVLDKPLTLIGEQPQTTIIQRTEYMYASSTLDITSDNVTVTGFTIASLANAMGIHIEASYTHEPSNCNITGNIISGGNVGIDTYGNYDPLLPFTWHQNILISQNKITGSHGQGIYVSSSNTTVSGNEIYGNSGDGVIVDSTVNVTIIGNDIEDNGAGATGPSEIGAGVNLRWFGPFYVYDNNITGNGYGVQFGEGAYNSTVFGNNVTNNYIGVNLLNFRIGGEASLGTGNVVFQNNLVGNSKQVVVDAALSYVPSGSYLNGTDSVAWDNGTVGNYWSNYSFKYPNASEVGNSDIGNTPYVIDANNVDHYPLMEAVNAYLISSSPTLSPSSSEPSPSSIPSHVASSSPSPSIPEFPSLTILLLVFVVAAVVSMKVRMKMQRVNPGELG